MPSGPNALGQQTPRTPTAPKTPTAPRTPTAPKTPIASFALGAGDLTPKVPTSFLPPPRRAALGVRRESNAMDMREEGEDSMPVLLGGPRTSQPNADQPGRHAHFD